MSTTRTKSLFRSVALLGAMAAGTSAFGSFYEWTAPGGVGYWSDSGSWTLNGDGDLSDWRIGNGPDLQNGGYSALTVQFSQAEATTDENPLYIYGFPTTFTADNATAGLTKGTLVLHPSWGWGGDLTLGTGTYTFGSIEANAALTLNGGKLVLGGGVTGTGSLAVGANGGTIEAAEAQTISTAVTGSGTLTKTGAGALAITGDVSAFTGAITVAEGAGSVTVGDSVIEAGETKSFAPDTTYYWTGAAEDGLWATPGNWTVGGEVPTAPPAADSVVVIPEGEGELTIKCAGASDYTGYLTINRDVTLVRQASAQYQGITVTQVNGTGTLKFSGNIRGSGTIYDQDYFNIYPTTEATFEINCNLDTYGCIRLERVRESSTSKWSKVLKVNGALKGTGRIICDGDTNSVQGMRFLGDTSGFEGSYDGCSRADWSRDATKFEGDARGSASASWHLGYWAGKASEGGYTPFLVNKVTYQFGQLTDSNIHFWRGYTGSNTTGATVEVGALAGKTSTVTGSLHPDNTLRKVGADSTLEYTNNGTANGTVEAYEGTTVIKGTATGFALKFAGPTATIKIARSTTTTTEVDSGVEDDPGTTDVDESKTTTTTTTDNIPAAFVPGFVDELAGYQYAVAQEEVDGVTYDVYTVVKVAKDSADVEYYTVAAAIAALAEAENKTITLTRDYGTTIALPLGYTLDSAGFACTVTGAAGVAVVETDGVWTTVDNSEAKWVGDAEGNWDVAANWSTKAVPDSGTKVVFEGDATVFLAGNNSYDCGEFNIAQGKTVTLAPVDYNEANWPRVVVHGDITSEGGCTLKLYRCGIDNGTSGTVNVSPTIEFYNTKGDSWLTGSFYLKAGLTGTGECRVYDGNLRFGKDSGITVNKGSVVDFRNGYPTFDGKSGTLSSTGVNGNGRIVVSTLPPSREAAWTYFQNAFKNGERWTGTLVINYAPANGGFNLNNLGSAYSTVAFAQDFGNGGYFTEPNVVVPTLSLETNVTIKNGSARAEAKKDEKLVTFTRLTGTGSLTTFATGNATEGFRMWYKINTLDGFTGSLVLSNRSVVEIDTVNVAEEPAKGALIVAATLGTDAEITGALKLTVGGEATETVLVYDAEKGGLVAYVEPASGLDPASKTPSVQVTAKDDDAAIAAAKALIVAPAGVDAAEYAECFKYKATAGEAGAYTVEVVDIAEATKAAVDVSALEVLNEVENAKIAVPAGLWYKITTMTELGGEAVETLSNLSDGAGVSVKKPGDTQGFIKVILGATEGAVTGTVDSSSGSNEGTEDL